MGKQQQNNITSKKIKTALIEALKEIFGENWLHDIANMVRQYNEPQQLIIETENGMQTVQLNALIYIDMDNYLCCFYMENEKTVKAICPLTHIIEQLPACFFQINRNTIINVKKMAYFGHKTRKIRLKNGDEFMCAKERIVHFKACLRQNSPVIKRKNEKTRTGSQPHKTGSRTQTNHSQNI